MTSSTQSPDLEKQPRPRAGYISLAAWIARDPDNETYVFRKFNRLSAKNLLNLQNELLSLECRIDSMEQEMLLAGESDPKQKRTILCWEAFERYAESLTQLEERKKSLETELKGKIKEYPKPAKPNDESNTPG